MSTSPLYSVIVPTCGRIPLLLETLDSLAAQSYGNFEVIIPDDSSQPEDRAEICRVAEAWGVRTGRPIQYVASEGRLYQAANTNQGLAVARGDVLRILHSDDVLRPDALEREAALLAKYPGVEVMFQDCIPFRDQVAWGTEPRETLIHPTHELRHESSHATALPSGMVFRREVVARTGFMDERLRFLCDWDFFSRLLLDQAQQGKMVCRLSPGLFGWRTHADSVTGALWQLHFDEHELFIREFLANPSVEALGILSDGERRQFVRRARKYRYERLWNDFQGLPRRRQWQARQWMLRRCFGPGAKFLGKRVGRRVERTVKKLVGGKKKDKSCSETPSADTWDAQRRTFRTIEENAGCVAIAPHQDQNILMTHPTSLVLDFDNAVHLWPYRHTLAAAKSVRLFHVNCTRMYERVLHEALKYVVVGQEAEVLLGGNEHLQWFGLKAVVDRLFPNQFVLCSQENVTGDYYRIRMRRQAPPPAYLNGEHTGWSFCLLTLGADRERVLRYVRSIEQSLPARYEILIVTPRRLDFLEGVPRLRQIIFNELDDVGWITRKKNLLCEAAQYSDILICHDRFEVTPSFCSDWERWGYSYGIAAPRVKLPDGRRGLDWAVASSQNNSWSHGGLLDYRSYSPYAYVPGGATIIRKAFWEKFPWNENLYWNEHEDVELCRRAQRHGEQIYLAPATLIASADRWIDQNPLIPYSEQVEFLFGGPVGEQRVQFVPFPKPKAAA